MEIPHLYLLGVEVVPKITGEQEFFVAMQINE
jgi:hypothetical protein